MTGGTSSGRLDKNRNERCIYDERGWEVIVSAMASFNVERSVFGG